MSEDWLSDERILHRSVLAKRHHETARARNKESPTRLAAALSVFGFASLVGLFNVAAVWLLFVFIGQAIDYLIFRPFANNPDREPTKVDRVVGIVSASANVAFMSAMPAYTWFAMQNPGGFALSLMFIMGVMFHLTITMNQDRTIFLAYAATQIFYLFMLPISSLVLQLPPGPASSLTVLFGSVLYTVYFFVAFRKHEAHNRALREAHHVAVQRRIAAEKADEAKLAFLSMMSHELRTPLNGILGMTQLLETTELKDQQKYFVETAKTAGDRMLRMVTDLVDMSSMVEAQFELDVDDVNLPRLLDAIVKTNKTLADEKHLQLAVEVAPNIPEIIRTDAVRLRQIINHLLDNAIAFTEPANGGVVALLVEAKRTDRDHATLSIRVIDTGAGIDETLLPDLFNPFALANTSTLRDRDGIGLGLPISWRLSRIMDGSLSIESEPGCGTRISVELSTRVVSWGVAARPPATPSLGRRASGAASAPGQEISPR